MTPIDHARLSKRDFGGREEAYLPIHEFLDQTKFHMTEWPHRMFLHNPLGIALCEQVFGITIDNGAGNHIPVREIARRHIMEDLGKVPTLKEWADAMQSGKMEPWMNNPNKRDLRWLKENYYAETRQHS
jgi:hypothetical protein